ncbi:hypothetical protein FDP41_006925 [Naegleria fowleri]|uniref:protein-tyrosine-phosphatase n=1 Tax=Naegleria fowleri TaxID=5763 RepID=A0A6A5BL14_NAEFO|nr:uncharacterized protein FDP41_006925 [Naegleria fowleri]KAF0974315.1 hypothetical protein FDP41_006925 [Naegleria fowleri]
MSVEWSSSPTILSTPLSPVVATTTTPNLTRKKSISSKVVNSRRCLSCPQFPTSSTSRKRVKLLVEEPEKHHYHDNDNTNRFSTTTTMVTPTNTVDDDDEEKEELSTCCGYCCHSSSSPYHHQEMFCNTTNTSPNRFHRNCMNHDDARVDLSPAPIAATSQNLTCSRVSNNQQQELLSNNTCSCKDPALSNDSPLHEFPPTIETFSRRRATTGNVNHHSRVITSSVRGGLGGDDSGDDIDVGCSSSSPSQEEHCIQVMSSPLNDMMNAASEEEFCSRMMMLDQDNHHPELLHSIKKEYNALVMDEMVSSGAVSNMMMMDEETFESNLYSAIERLEKKLEKIEKLEQLTTQQPIRYTNLKRKFISMFELGLSLRYCHSSPSLTAFSCSNTTSCNTPSMVSSPWGSRVQTTLTPEIGSSSMSSSCSELTPHLTSPVESIKDKHRRKVQSYLTQSPDKFGAFLTRKALKYYYKLNQQARYLIPQTKDTHFDATKITNQLWLGDIDDAFNDQGLKEHNISHIVTCVKSLEPIYPEKGYQYLNLHLYDEEDENIVEMFGVSFDFIDHAITSGHNVLVHCMKGKSRSASILIAYLMKKNSWTFEYALNFVKSKRTIVQPNCGFERQLLQLQDEIFQNSVDHGTPTMEENDTSFSALATSH